MDLLTKVINNGYFWGEFESTILSREILSKEIARMLEIFNTGFVSSKVLKCRLLK